MLRWPTRAQAALRRLFEPLQEVDVYVEDSNDEAFYRCLLNNATNGSVKIARVFGLGGRAAVLAAAKTHDHTKRRALFIIDGDLPWVRGEAPPSIVGLHQHEAYCVENLLICEKAVSLLLSQEAAIAEPAAQGALGFQQWRQRVLQPLVELFAAFATVNQLDPAIPTVAQGAGVMCTKDCGSKITALDSAKVQRARDLAVKAAEAVADPALVASRYRTFLLRIQSLRDPLLAISGKDFVIPLLDFHLQALGCRIRRRALRMRLASAGELDRFSALAESLLNTARGMA